MNETTIPINNVGEENTQMGVEGAGEAAVNPVGAPMPSPESSTAILSEWSAEPLSADEKLALQDLAAEEKKKDLSIDADTLLTWAGEHLTADEAKALEELIETRNKEYEANAEAIRSVTSKTATRENQDRQYRVGTDYHTR